MALVKKAILNSMFVALFVTGSGFLAQALEVGQKAPDFELTSTQGGKFKFSSLRGKNVLINFYNLDFNPA